MLKKVDDFRMAEELSTIAQLRDCSGRHQRGDLDRLKTSRVQSFDQLKLCCRRESDCNVLQPVSRSNLDDADSEWTVRMRHGEEQNEADLVQRSESPRSQSRASKGIAKLSHLVITGKRCLVAPPSLPASGFLLQSHTMVAMDVHQQQRRNALFPGAPAPDQPHSRPS